MRFSEGLAPPGARAGRAGAAAVATGADAARRHRLRGRLFRRAARPGSSSAPGAGKLAAPAPLDDRRRRNRAAARAAEPRPVVDLGGAVRTVERHPHVLLRGASRGRPSAPRDRSRTSSRRFPRRPPPPAPGRTAPAATRGARGRRRRRPPGRRARRDAAALGAGLGGSALVGTSSAVSMSRGSRSSTVSFAQAGAVAAAHRLRDRVAARIVADEADDLVRAGAAAARSRRSAPAPR